MRRLSSLVSAGEAELSGRASSSSGQGLRTGRGDRTPIEAGIFPRTPSARRASPRTSQEGKQRGRPPRIQRRPATLAGPTPDPGEGPPGLGAMRSIFRLRESVAPCWHFRMRLAKDRDGPCTSGAGSRTRWYAGLSIEWGMQTKQTGRTMTATNRYVPEGKRQPPPARGRSGFRSGGSHVRSSSGFARRSGLDRK